MSEQNFGDPIYDLGKDPVRCNAPGIADLERAVVEAAVAYRKRSELKWESECIKVCNTLDAAVDALIAAREREQDGDPLQSV